eukprot:4774330-Pleurochrysis_carterae.AAC.1
MVTVDTVIISREVLRGQPISTQGKEDIQPVISRLYSSSIAQNGLRSHLNSPRSGGSSAPICSLSSHSVFGNHRLTEMWACVVTRPSTTGAAIAWGTKALDEDPAN